MSVAGILALSVCGVFVATLAAVQLVWWWRGWCDHSAHPWADRFTREYMPGFPDPGSREAYCTGCDRYIRDIYATKRGR
jgi:hypothetical protein